MSINDQYYTSNHGDVWYVPDLLEIACSSGQIQRIPLEKLYSSYRVTKASERKNSQDFIQRALRADLRYPILVFQGRNGAFHICDGLHRYWKARHLGNSTIKARVIPYSALGSLT